MLVIGKRLLEKSKKLFFETITRIISLIFFVESKRNMVYGTSQVYPMLRRYGFGVGAVHFSLVAHAVGNLLHEK